LIHGNLMIQSLNIGFIVYDEDVPAWYGETISKVLDENAHTLYFLNFPSPAKQTTPQSIFLKLFRRFEENWFSSEFDALKSVSLREIVKNYSVKKFNVSESQELTENNFATLSALNLDLIYTIKIDKISDSIATSAKYGLWHIHFGIDKYSNASLPAFWEVMDGSPTTGSYLLMRRGGKDLILYEGTTTSVPHSVKNNFNSIAWKSASYVLYRIRTLSRLYDRFDGYFQATLNLSAVKKKNPSNTRMAFLFSKNIVGYIGYKFQLKFDKRRFTVLYALSSFDIDSLYSLKFVPIDLPENVFFADPFVLKAKDVNYIFFEEYVFAKNKAHISVIEVDKTGMRTAPRIALDKPYHLSYPFVFEFKGDYYMVPETSANKTIELYKASIFPGKWEFVMNLIEGMGLIDATLIFKNGLWWLFANSSNHPFVSTNDQLFLFYSDNLFSGEWKSHPQNPVATHTDNCRPAGRIFEKGGKMYRPAQNNASQQYGFGIKINEIEVMNMYDYKEKEIAVINPRDMTLKAIHNIDFSSDLVVIDGILNK
jgi:hypothetical protein